MMIRLSLAICLTSVLYISMLSANGPAGAPARTLEPNAVWSIFGGANFPDRCCRTVSGLCAQVDKFCNDPAWGGEVCFNRTNFDSHDGNKKFCHIPPIGGTTCTEGDYYECETWKRCIEDAGGNCVPDQVYNQQSAPTTCVDNCP
jgi:hypothetical protein